MSDIPAAQRFKHPIAVAVHRILWLEWDPIGVNDVAPDDEYDAYVGPIVELVATDKSANEIAEYLNRIAFERMGLSDCQKGRDHSNAIAARLRTLRQ